MCTPQALSGNELGAPAGIRSKQCPLELAVRVLIAIAQIPFLRRSTETLAEDLSTALRERGDRAEIVRIPFSWHTPEQLLDHLVATRLMDWTGSEGSLGDLLIALELPAYLLPHPQKILWLAHDGELNPAGRELTADDNGAGEVTMAAARQAVETMERQQLSEITCRFAVSAGVAASLKKRCAVDATPLYPPPRNPQSFSWTRPESYLLVPPGLPSPRVELILQALAEISSPLRVKHCGLLTEQAAESLTAVAQRLGVTDRVDWLGELPAARLARLYAGCFAVLYPSRNESFGSVTLEAGLSSKAIVTCSDSGAPAELVEHRHNGAVVPPAAGAIAAALDSLWKHPERTAVWGRAGRQAAESPAYGWPQLLDQLLAGSDR